MSCGFLALRCVLSCVWFDISLAVPVCFAPPVVHVRPVCGDTMSDLSTYIYIPNRIYIMYRYIYTYRYIYMYDRYSSRESRCLVMIVT